MKWGHGRDSVARPVVGVIKADHRNVSGVNEGDLELCGDGIKVL